MGGNYRREGSVSTAMEGDRVGRREARKKRAWEPIEDQVLSGMPGSNSHLWQCQAMWFVPGIMAGKRDGWVGPDVEILLDCKRTEYSSEVMLLGRHGSRKPRR